MKQKDPRKMKRSWKERKKGPLNLEFSNYPSKSVWNITKAGPGPVMELIAHWALIVYRVLKDQLLKRYENILQNKPTNIGRIPLEQTARQFISGTVD